MNFDEALKDHFEWRVKFRLAIAQKGTMDVATISKDNCCELGAWLRGEGSYKYRQLANFSKCVAQHAAFHAEAGKIASVINAKEYTKAEAMIGMGTTYDATSIATGLAIKELQRECELHDSGH